MWVCANASRPIERRLFGKEWKEMTQKEWQHAKHSSPMTWRDDGSEMLWRDEQFLNARFPSFVRRECGSDWTVRRVGVSSRQQDESLVTPEGMRSSRRDVNANVDLASLVKGMLRGKSISVRLVHDSKQELPRVWTFGGRKTAVSPVFVKAAEPTVVNEPDEK